MADNFKRGNVSQMPVNRGRNRLTAGKSPATSTKAQSSGDDLAGTLLDNLRINCLQVPAHFDGEETELWLEVTQTLAAANVLSRMDVQVLTAWCESWATCRKLRATLKMTGEVIRDPKGRPVTNPIRQSLHSELSLFQTLSKSLGLSPADRLRLQLLTAQVALATKTLTKYESGAEEAPHPVTVSF